MWIWKYIQANKHLDKRRIQPLADSIFVATMTILILEIKMPSGLGSKELQKYFLDHILPDLLIYVVKFSTLGIFWIGSHFITMYSWKPMPSIAGWISFSWWWCAGSLLQLVSSGIIDTNVSPFYFTVAIWLLRAWNYPILYYAWWKDYIKSNILVTLP